jgi:hypothetical protein
MSKYFGGDGKGGDGRGSSYEFSIFWRFIPEKWFFSDEFL